MRAIYDISVLGFGHRSNTRAGIFRAVEGLACHLLKVSDWQIDLASVKYLYESTTYLSTAFSCGRPQIAQSDVRQKLNGLVDSTGFPIGETSGAVRGAWRFARRLLRSLQKMSNASYFLLDPKILSQAAIYHASFFGIPDQVKHCTSLRAFMTVNDLIPVKYPDLFSSDNTQTLQAALDTLSSENYITTISQATKDDVCDYLKIDPSRVFVTYCAADPNLFYPQTDPAIRHDLLSRYSIPNAPYILTLGTLEPRKNMAHIIKCFGLLVKEGSLPDINLVVTGARGWNYDAIFAATAETPELSRRIIWTGRMPDEDLAALYSGALVFTYMSLYEGFGLPPLEAMQCGVPVVTSNVSSLPEVVGDAGILLDPHDEDSLCQALLATCQDTALQAALRVKSLAQASKFSWEASAASTIRAYHAVL